MYTSACDRHCVRPPPSGGIRFPFRREPRTVQRRAYVPGLVLLAALVTGCTSGSGADGSTADSKPGETIPAAAPGKYLTLREPCRTADQGVLKTMFPEIADLPKEQQEKAYSRHTGTHLRHRPARRMPLEGRLAHRGAPAADLDGTRRQLRHSGQRRRPRQGTVRAAADRRVGLRTGHAQLDAPGRRAGRRRRRRYPRGPPAQDARRARQRRLPRRHPGQAGRGHPQHTVRVVFRASNVLVTVEYSETPTDRAALPDIQGLQEMTRSMAHKLAEQISE